MSCGKCGKSSSFCPVSFGLALGLTAALAMVLWSVLMMYQVMPMPPMMMDRVPEFTWALIGKHAFWVFLKGFGFGFVFALIYDLIIKCCKSRCCKSSDADAACGCGNKMDIKR